MQINAAMFNFILLSNKTGIAILVPVMRLFSNLGCVPYIFGGKRIALLQNIVVIHLGCK